MRHNLPITCINLGSPLAVVFESSFLSSPPSECPSLAVLHPGPAACGRSPPPLSRVSTSFPIRASSPVTGTSTPTQGLVKKLSSELKPKISRSSTSEYSNFMPSSPRSEATALEDSSPRKLSKFSFSSRDKQKEQLEDSNGWPSDEVFSEGSSSSKRECIKTKKCSVGRSTLTNLVLANQTLSRNLPWVVLPRPSPWSPHRLLISH
uniref:Uncharacterized protein n=1 Tax=Physcomitrium patens TaxID=3218 RepID=A0A2K1JYL3_PHYPA|nr:hypothetical protein PHYPA_013738 [Physcomitrium patens]